MAPEPARVLAAAVGVVAIGLLGAAARGGDGSGEDRGDIAAAAAGTTRRPTTTGRPRAAATTGTPTIAVATTTSAPDADPANDTATDAPTSAPAPASAPPLDPGTADPSTIEPGPLRAPAVGAYFERYVGPGGGADGTLAVTRRADRTTLRRRVEGTISSRTFRFDDAGAHLLATEDGGGPCTYDDPPLHLPAVLEVGSTWTIDATCATPDGVAVRRQEEASVTGRARTTVDGATVDTVIVQRHVIETATRADVVVVSETASSELVAPALGLVVYSTSRTDTPDADGTIVSTAVAVELRSTTPS